MVVNKPLIVAVRKIKPLRLTIDAHVLVWEELGLFFRLVWPWLVICVLVSVTLSLFGLRVSENPGQFILLTTYSFSFTAFAVTWHRVVLEWEIGKGGAPFSLGRREIYSLAVCILLCSPLLIINFIFEEAILTLPFARQATARLGASAYSFVMFFIWLPITMRLSMLLPAISIDNAKMNFRQSWRCTKKNTLRLSFGFVLILMSFLLAAIFLKTSAPILGQLPYAFLILHSLPLIGFLFTAIGTGFLSMAYQVLVFDVQHDVEMPKPIQDEVA